MRARFVINLTGICKRVRAPKHWKKLPVAYRSRRQSYAAVLWQSVSK